MNRRGSLVVAVAGLLIIVVAVVAVLALRDGDRTASSLGEGGSVSTGGIASASGEGVSETPASGSGAGDAPGSAPSQSASAKDGEGSRAPGSSRPIDHSKSPGGLPILADPPPETIGMLGIPDGFTAARFEYGFTTQGWGPGGPDGGRLVADVFEAASIDEAGKGLKDVTGRLVVIEVPEPLRARVDGPGSYRGVIEVRRRGDAGAITMVEVSPAE